MASVTPSKRTGPAPRVRLATLADREAWVTVLRAGYELDHQFRWRHPWRKEFPEDAKKHSGDVFEAMMKDHEKKTCIVAELPKLESEAGSGTADEEEWTVVAICIWEWRTWEEYENEKCTCHRTHLRPCFRFIL